MFPGCQQRSTCTGAAPQAGSCSHLCCSSSTAVGRLAGSMVRTSLRNSAELGDLQAQPHNRRHPACQQHLGSGEHVQMRAQVSSCRPTDSDPQHDGRFSRGRCSSPSSAGRALQLKPQTCQRESCCVTADCQGFRLLHGHIHWVVHWKDVPPAAAAHALCQQVPALCNVWWQWRWCRVMRL